MSYKWDTKLKICTTWAMPQMFNTCNNQNSSTRNEIPKIHANNNHTRTSSFKTIAMIENTKNQQHCSIIQTTTNYKSSIITIYTLYTTNFEHEKIGWQEEKEKSKKKQAKQCHLDREKCKRMWKQKKEEKDWSTMVL
jgi:hypothetical protein